MTPPPPQSPAIPRLDIKGVAFDLDGTLANTLPAMEASWNAVVGPLIGRHIPREEIVSNLGPRAIEIVRKYVTQDAEAVSNRLSSHFSDATTVHARLYSGVRELVETLAASGFALGVVTSMGRRNAIPLLDHLGLLDYFSIVVTEDDVTQLKPAAEPVVMTAEGMGVSCDRLLVIGDNPTDMLAARAAGALGGAAVWGFYGRQGADLADQVFERPEQVLEMLR